MTTDDLVRPRSLGVDLDGLRSGALTPAGYLNLLCERIDEVDPRLRAFVAEPDRRARLARVAARSDPAAPLAGLAVAVKDIIHVDGLATRAGSDVPTEALSGSQASVVTRLLAAGAAILGKTVTAEFAVAAPGPTVNPHHLGHTPGGSSSGSAAAVAAGMAPLALGTQTIGSVIRPAAYCGIVGFKPSYGRIPTDGVIAHSPSLDTLGWFTATVADAALAAATLCPGWRAAGAGRPPVLGVPAETYLARAGEAARRAYAGHLGTLREDGFQVRHSSVLTDFADVVACLVTVDRWELARTHETWFRAHGDRYRPQTAAGIREGQRIDRADYEAALRRKRDFTAALADATASAGVDVWLTPAATSTAPAGLDSTGDPVMSIPFSLAGFPAVSVPAGRDAHGLPWGLQCAGPPGGDEQLLEYAAGIERCLTVRRPAGRAAGTPGPGSAAPTPTG